ncbi:MAG TPA: FAD-linked oxidase C-terminal domain-containing protein [Gemmatimonadaceae bacterium]
MSTGDHRDLEEALRRVVSGEVRFDPLTRQIYSTDASIYAIEPIGVVSPRSADDVMATVQVAGQYGVPVLPRGAGTSLAGQTVGRAVVLDFSRYLHELVEIDSEARTARVQPGLVQDDLNTAVARHGLMFAPDTSTANRATLGGMIGNNSCGSRSARYGMTIDHVDSIDVVLSDGSRATLGAMAPDELARRGRGDTLEASLYRAVPALVGRRGDAIRTGFPPYWRRSGGYRLERLLPERGPFDLSKVVVGSEGTLAITVGATVQLVPLPGAVAAVAGHFDSVPAALAAVEDALDSHAAAIELVDREILNLARVSPLHRHLVSVLSGDPGALLWVEFYGDTPAEASALAAALEERWQRHHHGYAIARATTTAELRRFREVRKAGLGLLSAAGRGSERSIAFVEDTAVDPRQLAAYTMEFARILERHGLRAGFYGHASAGCLHIRPFMDLGRPGEVARMRAVAGEVADLVQRFGGMNSSEHGDGLVRAEFSRQLFGDELYEAMRELKGLFDPGNRLNPGKKVDAPAMTASLREPALPRALPLATEFPFSWDDGMRGAANRCVRVGACRKSGASGGTMCPSFMATRDERHSTRGRANALVAALSSPDPRAALGDDALMEALDLCLECKACKSECPMSVDMATLKAETMHHRYAVRGVPLSARFFGDARRLNRLGARTPRLANAVSGSSVFRRWAEQRLGIDRRRPLPRFAAQSLSQWYRRRTSAGSGARGNVIFFADSFTSYTEPSIGAAAIELLERAGWRVQLVDDVCCGRSQISKGLLPAARRNQAALLDRLGPAATAGTPIVGCEPSCIFTLQDELVALARGDERAAAIARQARLVDALLTDALDDGSLSFRKPLPDTSIVLHGHCHQKAAGALAPTVNVLERIPGARVTALDAGCCGMAGSFGFEREHYDLSMQIGEQRLFPAVRGAPGAVVVATGVSCRQQILHGTGREAVHPVSLLRQLIAT